MDVETAKMLLGFAKETNRISTEATIDFICSLSHNPKKIRKGYEEYKQWYEDTRSIRQDRNYTYPFTIYNVETI